MSTDAMISTVSSNKPLDPPAEAAAGQRRRWADPRGA